MGYLEIMMRTHTEILEERIAYLEHLLQHAQCGIDKCFTRIEELEKERDKGIERLKKLEEDIKKLKEIHINKQKCPRKCPVCQPGLLNESLAQIALKKNPGEPLICPACEGKGIVWG